MGAFVSGFVVILMVDFWVYLWWGFGSKINCGWTSFGDGFGVVLMVVRGAGKGVISAAVRLLILVGLKVISWLIFMEILGREIGLFWGGFCGVFGRFLRCFGLVLGLIL